MACGYCYDGTPELEAPVLEVPIWCQFVGAAAKFISECGGAATPEAEGAEVAYNMCCSDGCGTDGWEGWSTKAAYCPTVCGYCYDGTPEQLAVTATMEVAGNMCCSD